MAREVPMPSNIGDYVRDTEVGVPKYTRGVVPMYSESSNYVRETTLGVPMSYECSNNVGETGALNTDVSRKW